MLHGGPDSSAGRENFSGKGRPFYRDFLPWAVQKRSELIDLPLGCGFEWAEAKHRRAHWRQIVNTTEPPVCGDAALCQITLMLRFGTNELGVGVFNRLWDVDETTRCCVTVRSVVSVYHSDRLPESLLRNVPMCGSRRFFGRLCCTHKYQRHG